MFILGGRFEEDNFAQSSLIVVGRSGLWFDIK